MTTRKPHLTAEEKLNFAKTVRTELDNGATLWVTVPHTSRSNMSYTVRARLLGGSSDCDLWLNYWLGAEMGATLDASDDLKQNGLGTHRGFQLACDLAAILRGHGLAEARFEYEIKTGWF